MARVGSKNPPSTRKPGKPKKGEGPLSEADRTEIVTRLAMYDSVAEIHKDLTERGIVVTHQAISAYNPGGANKTLAAKWITLFHETRQRFIDEMAAEPIAHRAYRLRQLDKLYRAAAKRGAIPLAAQILEQAAKEVGNVFSNVTKVKGQVDHLVAEVQTTPDEMRNMLADRLKEAMMRQAKPVQIQQLSDQSAKG